MLLRGGCPWLGKRPVLQMHITKAGLRAVARDAFTTLPWLLGAPAAAAGRRLQGRDASENITIAENTRVTVKQMKYWLSEY